MTRFEPQKEENNQSVKRNLLGLTLLQLQELCAGMHFPRFTAKQICDWLYRKRVDSIDSMTNLSLAQRAALGAEARIGREVPQRCQVSRDGTKKYLFDPGVEAVYIPEDERATLCVSSQVGCRMGCRFCVTGQQGFHGHLTAGDILNQLFTIPEFESLTVSTVGLVPQMRRFIEECQCHLAVSLHNPVPAERLAMMPVQKAYPLADVLALLRQYDWSGQRRLSFEYTMFHNENDDLGHAARLVEALRGLDCRVNLIRFHESPEAPYRTSSPAAINAFRDYLNRHGVVCTVRASRGQDIDAACGLLAGRRQG